MLSRRPSRWLGPKTAAAPRHGVQSQVHARPPTWDYNAAAGSLNMIVTIQASRSDRASAEARCVNASGTSAGQISRRDRGAVELPTETLQDNGAHRSHTGFEGLFDGMARQLGWHEADLRAQQAPNGCLSKNIRRPIAPSQSRRSHGIANTDDVGWHADAARMMRGPVALATDSDANRITHLPLVG